MSEADKPLMCTRPREDAGPSIQATCEKRFWTRQHLEAHILRVHDGVKAYSVSDNLYHVHT